MIEGRNRFLRSLDMFPAQMVAWCGQMVASFGYTVAYPMDRSFAVIEGASVGGLITPILGTYQVAGDAGMERLMLFQARPVKDDFPIDSINFELDEFIEAGNLTRCQQDLDSMQNHENGEPLAEYCGLDDWKTVRGQIDENWQDYRTGASVPLLYSIEWNGWLLDQVKGRSLKFEV